MKGFKFKNRAMTALISGCLVAGLLTGCGTKSDTDANKTVTADNGQTVIRVCWWGNQTRNDGTVKALEMYEAEHPNVKFEVEFSDWGGYWDKLSTQAAGSNLPDIIQMDYAYIKQYVEKGQLIGMKPYIDSNVIDTTQVADSIMASGTINGDVYGICSGVQSKALLVNKDVMEEAGVTLAVQPTYDELIQAAQTIYDKTGKQIEIPSNDEQTMLFLARSIGQTMYNEAGDGLGMPDKQVSLRYFHLLKDSLDAGYHVSPESMAEASTNQQSMLAAGKVWCSLTNSNQITNTINQCDDDFNYEIYMYPTEANATVQPLYLKPSMFYSITKDSKNPEIAADVINYLTNSEEANKTALRGERGVPVSSTVAKAIEDVLDEPTARINEYVAEVTKVATPIDPPFPPASAEIGKVISDLADMVRYMEISPEDAADEFYNKATELLKKGAESER